MSKARGIVRAVRISSVATQHLLQKEGRTVCADCPTRWNSTYLMLKWLLDIRPGLTDVYETMGWDSLLASEWQKIDEICTLLQPFYEHMQADSVALSNVLPVLLDLKCHLQLSQDVPNVNVTATSMLTAFDHRFSKLLNCAEEGFDPLAASACYLDPLTRSTCKQTC